MSWTGLNNEDIRDIDHSEQIVQSRLDFCQWHLVALAFKMIFNNVENRCAAFGSLHLMTLHRNHDIDPDAYEE